MCQMLRTHTHTYTTGRVSALKKLRANIKNLYLDPKNDATTLPCPQNCILYILFSLCKI